MASETTITTMPLSAIPNRGRLRCNQEHAKPNLVHGVLLEEKGCIFNPDAQEPNVNVCKECLDDLKKGGDDVNSAPPKFSLANGLWYGPTPDVLTCLTMPEQLLIALYYPRVFVIKLQPRRGATGFNPETLQNALVGNVISFEQNTQRIAEMAEGKLMPRKPSILAELISIALVSVGPLHKSWLKRTFRVRRFQVWQALVWLKKNNWYYRDIVISEDIMASLPEDDIPDSTFSVIRCEGDPDAAERERETYVPTDNTTYEKCE